MASNLLIHIKDMRCCVLQIYVHDYVPLGVAMALPAVPMVPALLDGLTELYFIDVTSCCFFYPAYSLLSRNRFRAITNRPFRNLPRLVQLWVCIKHVQWISLKHVARHKAYINTFSPVYLGVCITTQYNTLLKGLWMEQTSCTTCKYDSYVVM